MLYYYKEEKKVSNGELYKIEKGIYCDEKFPSELSLIVKKYPKAILTLSSAFFYYELTDKTPDYYHLATDKKSRNIDNKSVKQIYTKRELLDIGITKITIEDVIVNIYDKERMLIELIRYKSKLPMELGKLNNIDGFKLEFDKDKIEELSHQDYHGKRLTVTISDSYNKSYNIKLDVGVHKHIDILQDTLLLDTKIIDANISFWLILSCGKVSTIVKIWTTFY